LVSGGTQGRRRRGLRRSFGSGLFEAERRARACGRASETGGGHPGLGLVLSPQGTAQAYTAWTGPAGTGDGACAIPRCPPTQRVMALPRHGDRELGKSGAGGDVSPHFYAARSGTSSRREARRSPPPRHPGGSRNLSSEMRKSHGLSAGLEEAPAFGGATLRGRGRIPSAARDRSRSQLIRPRNVR
jgi:hypothetical protein